MGGERRATRRAPGGAVAAAVAGRQRGRAHRCAEPAEAALLGGGAAGAAAHRLHGSCGAAVVPRSGQCCGCQGGAEKQEPGRLGNVPLSDERSPPARTDLQGKIGGGEAYHGHVAELADQRHTGGAIGAAGRGGLCGPVRLPLHADRLQDARGHGVRVPQPYLGWRGSAGVQALRRPLQVAGAEREEDLFGWLEQPAPRLGGQRGTVSQQPLDARERSGSLPPDALLQRHAGAVSAAYEEGEASAPRDAEDATVIGLWTFIFDVLCWTRTKYSTN
mmetsp:Transcript_16559/g.42725  ORF Transcript_16559/g.42725 Transcript_16559/m.42725 type:complete len:275 (-) Transcript_16559:349-1173(-)